MKTSPQTFRAVKIITGIIGSFLSVFSGLQTYGETPVGLTSLRSFIEADSQQLRSWADLKPLKPTVSPDDIAVDVGRKINEFAHLTEGVPVVHWADGWGCCAHPDAGILLDRKQLGELKDARKGESV